MVSRANPDRQAAAGTAVAGRALRNMKRNCRVVSPSGYFTRVQVSVLQMNQTQPLILTVFASMTSTSPS